MEIFIGVSQIFFSALIVGFSGAIVPGPMFTTVITNVAKNGFKDSILIVIGHALTELIILILFLAGILKYLNNDIVIKIIGITGGLVLLFLSINLIYSIIRNKIKLNLNNNKINKINIINNNKNIDNNLNNVNHNKAINKNNIYKKNINLSFFQGMLVSIINPYWYLWWVTIGAAFLVKSLSFKYAGVGFFYFGHISSDFIWYMIVGLIVSKGKKFLNEKIYKIIIILCAVFLFYLGIKFIIDFIKR